MKARAGTPKRNCRQSILLAAQKLFARFGPRKTTVDEIIKLAQTAKGTFYKYFPDKEALFREIIDRENENLIAAIRRAVDEASSPREKLRAFLLVRAKKIQESVNLYHVTQEMVDEYWPMISDVRERHFVEEQKIVHEILLDGVRTGQLTVDKPSLTAYAIVMAVKGLEIPWMLETSSMDLEEGIDVLLNVLFKGIEPR